MHKIKGKAGFIGSFAVIFIGKSRALHLHPQAYSGANICAQAYIASTKYHSALDWQGIIFLVFRW